MTSLTLGTRGSPLARWQSESVLHALRQLEPALTFQTRVITTMGDRDKSRPLDQFTARGVFTTDIETALLNHEIDLAVHSLKDLPTDVTTEPHSATSPTRVATEPRSVAATATPSVLRPPSSIASLTLAAILQRADPRDVLISRHNVGLFELPPAARIGTSSTRRTAQLLALRPDLTIVPLRGNVDTRLQKATTADYDAIILAAAGVLRLGRADAITAYLSIEEILPDPGQGALAVQIRSAVSGEDDTALFNLVSQLDHALTRQAVTAERAFLHALGGGCAMPIAAYAEITGESGDTLHLRGLLANADGSQLHRAERRGTTDQPEAIGIALANEILQNGGSALSIFTE